jgi:nucleoside diphosphate kinase
MAIERNPVHGSDAPATARTEIACFFRPTEPHPYDWNR